MDPAADIQSQLPFAWHAPAQRLQRLQRSGLPTHICRAHCPATNIAARSHHKHLHLSFRWKLTEQPAALNFIQQRMGTRSGANYAVKAWPTQSMAANAASRLQPNRKGMQNDTVIPCCSLPSLLVQAKQGTTGQQVDTKCIFLRIA